MLEWVLNCRILLCFMWFNRMHSWDVLVNQTTVRWPICIASKYLSYDHVYGFVNGVKNRPHMEPHELFFMFIQ